ncbi:ATP-binding protein [Ruegeria intermedia]|nr:ATP-binding protein [Ruegeria intermedia]
MSNVYGVACVIGVALTIILSVFLYMSHATGKRFGDMRENWLIYSGDTSPQGYWISDIRGYFGYGGLIHNFKNYVLRSDPTYGMTLRRQSSNLLQTLESYRTSNASPAEKEAVTQIEAVVREYVGNIEKIEAGIAAGLSAEEIDELVRVDDRQALEALATLEALWIAERDQSLSNMVRSFSEGERLVRRFSIFLVGLIILVGVIGILTTLLMAYVLRTNRRLQQELEIRKQAELAERKLARAVDQSPTSIVITDTNMRIEYANRKFLEMSGYDVEEVLGQTPRILKSGYSSEESYRSLRTALNEGRSWNGVFRNLHKDGSQYWVSNTFLPLLDQDGAVTHYICIGEDMTESRRTREKFAQVQKMEAVGILAGSVAHDFNNVLMSVTGNADLIELDAEGNEDILTSVNHIRIAARRAQGLVRKMLTFARQKPRNPQRSDLVKAAQDALELIRVSAPPNIEIRFQSRIDAAFADLDGTLFFQTLLNLCHNAFEAIGDRPGVVALEISRAERDTLSDIPDEALGAIRVDVSDTGPGIPEDLQAKIFEPFFSTKPVGKGTGLGLTIVRNSVEECRGSVELVSTPGQGTRFSLFFPEMPALSTEEQREIESIAGNEHVLLVDDDENVLYVSRRLLASYGYRVEAYSLPTKALDAFRAAPDSYDILVSDLMMPDLSGTELIEAVRGVRPDLPAILISSYFENTEVAVSGEMPVMAQKPLEIRSLARLIRSLMN